MKAYFARRKADGQFLGKGRRSYHHKFDDKSFPPHWTKIGYLKRCATVMNTYGKKYNLSAHVPIDLATDYDIIEVDFSAALQVEVDKIEAIEKAILFGGTP